MPPVPLTPSEGVRIQSHARSRNLPDSLSHFAAQRLTAFQSHALSLWDCVTLSTRPLPSQGLFPSLWREGLDSLTCGSLWDPGSQSQAARSWLGLAGQPAEGSSASLEACVEEGVFPWSTFQKVPCPVGAGL